MNKPRGHHSPRAVRVGCGESGPDGVPLGGGLRRPHHRAVRCRQDDQQIPLLAGAYPRGGQSIFVHQQLAQPVGVFIWCIGSGETAWLSVRSESTSGRVET